MRTAALAALAVLAAAPAARAGDFCGGATGPDTLRGLQRYATGKAGVEFDVDCFDQAYDGAVPAAVQAKIVAACTQAVVLPEKRRDATVDHWCATTVLGSGTAVVGDRDLVAERIAAGGTWNYWPDYGTVAASGDRRARGFVLSEFPKQYAAWKAKKLRVRWAVDIWTRHEVEVLDALGRVGLRDDLALVAAIEADNHDGRIKAAARRARDGIAARSR